jgi:hypothetical protein
MIEVDPRFSGAIAAIDSLQDIPRYEAAFVYGSVAQGTADEHSDIDVHVVTDRDIDCEELNHPTVAGIKFDIRFRSFQQILESTQDEVAKGERQPRLSVGEIIFDKTGVLTALQARIREVPPPKYGPSDYQAIQFTLHHTTEKARRFLETNPTWALYSMHDTIGEVLRTHFRLNGQWWVGSKKVLHSLESWDVDMADLVKRFVSVAEPREKFGCWKAITERIATQIGGQQETSEMNCTCSECVIDLAALTLGSRAVKSCFKDA